MSRAVARKADHRNDRSKAIRIVLLTNFPPILNDRESAPFNSWALGNADPGGIDRRFALGGERVVNASG